MNNQPKIIPPMPNNQLTEFKLPRLVWLALIAMAIISLPIIIYLIRQHSQLPQKRVPQTPQPTGIAPAQVPADTIRPAIPPAPVPSPIPFKIIKKSI